MKSLPAKLWVLFLIGAAAAFWIRYPAPLFIHVIGTLLALLFMAACINIIPRDETGYEKGALISFLGTPWRSVGSGPVLLFQPFGIPIERVYGTCSLAGSEVEDKMNGQTINEEIVPLDFSFTYRPLVDQLWKFAEWANMEDREDLYKRHVKSLISREVHQRQSREDVYRESQQIADAVKDKFRQERTPNYGIAIRCKLNEPKLPRELLEG